MQFGERTVGITIVIVKGQRFKHNYTVLFAVTVLLTLPRNLEDNPEIMTKKESSPCKLSVKTGLDKCQKTDSCRHSIATGEARVCKYIFFLFYFFLRQINTAHNACNT